MSDFNKLFLGKVAKLKLFGSKICDDEERMKLLKLLESGESLPAGYTRGEENQNVFYKMDGQWMEDLSPEEILMIVQLQQANDTKIIKNCTIFFTVLTALLLAGSIVLIAVLSRFMA